MSKVNCKGLSYDDCEIAIMRSAIDKKDLIKGKEGASSSEIKKMVKMVEEFMVKNSLMCYGGTAVNNILPVKDRFYDTTREIPDYDFYSPRALHHAKELADIYYKAGYNEVEAKSGKHLGTYKVFVNYTPIADITQMDERLYNELKKHSITVNHILYAPPNYLRMALYLELSRPAGDISRWEKLLKRINLLNKHYPIKTKKCDQMKSFIRSFTSKTHSTISVFQIIKNFLIDQGVIFFGGWAFTVYSQFMDKKNKKKFNEYPDFDVISTDAEKCVNLLVSYIKTKGLKDVSYIKHDGLDEVIAEHYEVKIGSNTVAFIYQSLACYSYNNYEVDKKVAKIATIETIMSMYLAFIYANRDYFNYDKILCLCKLVYDIQQNNRLKQSGLLKRFSIKCDGTQATRESMKKDKSDMFQKLKDKKKSAEYEIWFLNYRPDVSYTKNKKQNEIVITPKKDTRKNKIKTDDNEVKSIIKDKSIKKGKTVKKVKKAKTVKKIKLSKKAKTVKNKKGLLSRIFKI